MVAAEALRTTVLPPVSAIPSKLRLCLAQVSVQRTVSANAESKGSQSRRKHSHVASIITEELTGFSSMRLVMTGRDGFPSMKSRL